MFISIGQVAKLAGVSKSTLRRWEKADYLISDYRTRGNHRRYRFNKILKFLGIRKSEKKTFIYARVSASRQKDDLNRQITSLKQYAGEKGWKITGIYKDIASRLNDGRRNLLRMISDISTKLPAFIICTYRDRVARIGTRLLEEFCSIDDIYNVELVETQIKEISEDEKLIHSIIAILTSFLSKLYRSRRGRIKEIPALT